MKSVRIHIDTYTELRNRCRLQKEYNLTFDELLRQLLGLKPINRRKEAGISVAKRKQKGHPMHRLGVGESQPLVGPDFRCDIWAVTERARSVSKNYPGQFEIGFAADGTPIVTRVAPKAPAKQHRRRPR